MSSSASRIRYTPEQFRSHYGKIESSLNFYYSEYYGPYVKPSNWIEYGEGRRFARDVSDQIAMKLGYRVTIRDLLHDLTFIDMIISNEKTLKDFYRMIDHQHDDINLLTYSYSTSCDYASVLKMAYKYAKQYHLDKKKLARTSRVDKIRNDLSDFKCRWRADKIRCQGEREYVLYNMLKYTYPSIQVVTQIGIEKYYVDIYIPIVNLVIEYHEAFHVHCKERDAIRNKSIKEMLQCKLIIIKDSVFQRDMYKVLNKLCKKIDLIAQSYGIVLQKNIFNKKEFLLFLRKNPQVVREQESDQIKESLETEIIAKEVERACEQKENQIKQPEQTIIQMEEWDPFDHSEEDKEGVVECVE